MYLPDFTRTASGFEPTVSTVLRTTTVGPVRLDHLKASNPRDDPRTRYQDPGDVLAWSFIAGGAVVAGRGRAETAGRAGHLTVQHVPRVTRVRMTPDFRALSIRLSPTVLPLTSAEIDTIGARSYPLADGAPRLLALMADQLMTGDRLGEASRAALAQSIVDLARGFAGDVTGRGRSGDGTAGLVFRARRHIQLYLRSGTLTPATVAEHLGVPLRTLQKAFEDEDTTVADTIREARLGRARDLLENDPGRRLPIETIAERAGFRSASTFSRAFSTAFGTAPRDWRRSRSSGRLTA
ncbi:helix-turn-helix domain-containing protein [Paractinoplanes toevensis]|uniref:HTH araC/xylS-type domain-containing protein n=1 Tax=Paractinoplanes toevensis TaxID=571911 RepID=A0A919W0X7_9ACTN|nr:helix-turn-helix domain-containing protein [Actinoplanes toevensis]GIM91787.1 hypothetical protein Ato02nite_035800 [Actinoplanes toevensis]